MGSGGDIPEVPARPDEQDRPRVGVDEWVANVDERREERAGIAGFARRIDDFVPPWARLAAFGLVAASLPLWMDRGDLFAYGIFTLIYVLLGLGLNVVVGYAGLLDLGYVAFFGFGAYFYALLSSEHYGIHWPSAISFPVVVVSTAVLGLVLGIPSRRLLGDYLAIVTLFFGQAFVVFVNAANPTVRGQGLTGGPNGIADIDANDLFGYELTTRRQQYWFILAAVLVVLVGLHFLSESRTGRAWRALREDPLAAEAMSIPVNRLKLMAFAFGAAIAGLTGCMFAAVLTAVTSGNFALPILITIYADGHPRRHRQPDRGRHRRDRDQRLLPVPRAGEPAGQRADPLLRRDRAPPRCWASGRCGGGGGSGRHARLRARRAHGRRGHLPVVDGAAQSSRAAGFGDVVADWVIIPAGNERFANAAYIALIVGDPRADQDRRLVAHRAPGPDRLPRDDRLGDELRRATGRRPLDPLRRAARLPDDQAAAGPARDPARGDRLMAEKAPLFELREVTKSFGGLVVADELSLHVDEGEIVSLIGPNGAGKTTVFNLVTGIYRPDSGEIRFERRDIVGLAPHKITQLGIARTFQTLRLFLNMTVKENVMAAAYGHTQSTVVEAMFRLPRARREEREIARWPRRSSRSSARGSRATARTSWRTASRTQTGGDWRSRARWRRIRGCCCSTSRRPGMNPAETHEMTDLIGRLRTEGGYTILVIEHDMHVVEGISDRVVALDHGMKIAEGSFERSRRTIA